MMGVPLPQISIKHIKMMICKKKILSAMVLMGTASTLMAQTTVKGRVTDQNGEPVIKKAQK